VKAIQSLLVALIALAGGVFRPSALSSQTAPIRLVSNLTFENYAVAW
jgi:hypothetical protein